MLQHHLNGNGPMAHRYVCMSPACVSWQGISARLFHEAEAVIQNIETGHDVVEIVSLWPGDWDD